VLGDEVVAVGFQEHERRFEPGAFVALLERMVLGDAEHEVDGQGHDVVRPFVGIAVIGLVASALQQPMVTHAMGLPGLGDDQRIELLDFRRREPARLTRQVSPGPWGSVWRCAYARLGRRDPPSATEASAHRPIERQWAWASRGRSSPTVSSTDRSVDIGLPGMDVNRTTELQPAHLSLLTPRA